jgi:MFS family permease
MTAQIAATPHAESGGTLISPQRRNFVFLAITLGMLMAALDKTVVATALPTIVADLGDAGHQSWVVTSYLLASTIITALAGRLGDLFGRKRVFQAAVTLLSSDRRCAGFRSQWRCWWAPGHCRVSVAAPSPSPPPR